MTQENTNQPTIKHFIESFTNTVTPEKLSAEQTKHVDTLCDTINYFLTILDDNQIALECCHDMRHIHICGITYKLLSVSPGVPYSNSYGVAIASLQQEESKQKYGVEVPFMWLETTLGKLKNLCEQKVFEGRD